MIKTLFAAQIAFVVLISTGTIAGAAVTSCPDPANGPCQSSGVSGGG